MPASFDERPSPRSPRTPWTPIRYPQAIWDDQLGCWASDAEVAETCYTAFASKRPASAPVLDAAARLGRFVAALQRISAAGGPPSVRAGPPRWVHADLNPVNLLARQGRLTAVIDFGELAAADPAITQALADYLQ